MELHNNIQMILQILAHPWKVVQAIYPMGSKLFGVSDTGKFQQLRRLNRTRA
jgi:hypothetical protein